jgi:methanogenic corrinoid protein MtbC1
MNTNAALETLGADGLQRFHALRGDAVGAVTERFYATHGSAYEKFGPRGRDACREDLAFHLEFLRPVLEFGLLQPMVDYLRWLDSVLAARAIPSGHLALSLQWMAEFYAGRMEAAEGALVSGALHAALAKFLQAGEAPSPKAGAAWPEAAAFEAALLCGDQRAALALVNRCIDAGHGLVEVEMHLIQPALYHIGDQWQANQVSVAQEHMATAIAQSVMTAGLLRSAAPAPLNRRALLACVEGNNHAVGLRMVADAFLLGGWDVQYLGANVPTSALVAQAAAWKPDLVGLSVSFAQQLPVVKAAIVQLDRRLGAARPAVMIGGLAINRFSPLAGVAGAEAYSPDASAALVEANRVIGHRVIDH